jgi:hypothetical protein
LDRDGTIVMESILRKGPLTITIIYFNNTVLCTNYGISPFHHVIKHFAHIFTTETLRLHFLKYIKIIENDFYLHPGKAILINLMH